MIHYTFASYFIRIARKKLNREQAKMNYFLEQRLKIYKFVNED